MLVTKYLSLLVIFFSPSSVSLVLLVNVEFLLKVAGWHISKATFWSIFSLRVCLLNNAFLIK